MSLPKNNDPDFWRLRAEEALAIAYEMTNADAISKMLRIVGRYEQLARHAEAPLPAK